MKLTEWMRSLDRRVLGPAEYVPKTSSERLIYLQQSGTGLPMLGYADVVRPILTELVLEVVALRAEVETLKREQ
jgi:hypothetical protein